MKVIEEVLGLGSRSERHVTLFSRPWFLERSRSSVASICDLHCATGWRKRWIRNRGKVSPSVSPPLSSLQTSLNPEFRTAEPCPIFSTSFSLISRFTRAPFLLFSRGHANRIGQRTVLVIIVGKIGKSSLDPYESTRGYKRKNRERGNERIGSSALIFL